MTQQNDGTRAAARAHAKRKRELEDKAKEGEAPADIRVSDPPVRTTTGYMPPYVPEVPGSKQDLELRGGALPRRWLTLADAYEPRAPLTYYVDGVLPAGSLSMLYGAPGSLKTMLALDMLVSVASGQSWLPPIRNGTGHGIKTERVPVLHVDYDSGERVLQERIEALARARNITDPQNVPLYLESFGRPWLMAGEPDSVHGLAEAIKARGVRLVVIDNLGTITGGIDENTSGMVPVLGNLRELAEDTGAAVVLIHHERKGTVSSNTGGRHGESVRGHSSILAALDAALLVEREAGSNIITVRSTKTRSVPVVPFSAQWTYEHKPGTKELATGRFYGLGEDTEHVTDAAITRAIIGGSEKPVKQGELVDAVHKAMPGAGVNRIRKLIDIARLEGHLAATTGDKGARIYQAA